ncbi:4Fe-4S binding protein [Clostridium sp.]|uniref:4Fe-4S binding protein n=1 Tax=Clostridium sp. TaxID=1506 RepID=UPI003216E42D
MYSNQRITELKGLGFLLQNDKEHFSVRFLSRAGNMTSEEMINVSHIAKKYGRGYMGFTTRLSVEVPWIHGDNVDKLIEEAKSLGLKHGGTGKKLRPLTSCKGTICLHGNIDTQGLCNRLSDKEFGESTPHKCKIGISGCANNCAKANLNDIGIIGLTIPSYNDDKCVGCGICIKGCRQGALKLVDKKIQFDRSKCVNCGGCVRSCKPGAFTIKETGAKIFIGGRFGRAYRFGTDLGQVFKEDEIFDVVEKILTYYRENGESLERISYVMDRLGEEAVINGILKTL